ncbi:MAG: xanthine phosphoribosyltransferase [Lagierella massiliensis]|nr:xanthine phosphoribosyltransferase [Lagierella massiliensis]
MNKLEKKILDEGVVLSENILKVDGFVNHRIDPLFFMEIGKEFAKRFKDKNIDKILTLEVSGIAIAFAVGIYLKKPVIFAKKNNSKTLGEEVYSTTVYSYTKDINYFVKVSKKFLESGDRVLIIDDFLANGKALEGLIDICNQSNSTVEGIGILIEKGFQKGGSSIREKGYEIESLAIIKSLDNGRIEFDKSKYF